MHGLQPWQAYLVYYLPADAVRCSSPIYSGQDFIPRNLDDVNTFYVLSDPVNTNIIHHLALLVLRFKDGLKNLHFSTEQRKLMYRYLENMDGVSVSDYCRRNEIKPGILIDLGTEKLHKMLKFSPHPQDS